MNPESLGDWQTINENSAYAVANSYNDDLSELISKAERPLILAGNGGMLCTSNEELYTKAKLLRSWGRSSSMFSESESIENRFNVSLEGIQYDAKFVFEELGYQLEPSEISAAFALVQLKKLEHNINLRRRFFNDHLKFFSRYEKFFDLPEQTKNSYTGWLAFPLVVKDDAPFMRTDLQIFLEERNIQTRVVFTGNILRQPGFKDIICKGSPDDFIVADGVMRGGHPTRLPSWINRGTYRTHSF